MTQYIRDKLLLYIRSSSDCIDEYIYNYFKCGHRCINIKCCWCADLETKCDICVKKQSTIRKLDSRCYREDGDTCTFFCIECRDKVGNTYISGRGKIYCDKCKYDFIKSSIDSDCLNLDDSLICYICEKSVDNKNFIYIRENFENVYLSFCSVKCRSKYKTIMEIVDYHETSDRED